MGSVCKLDIYISSHFLVVSYEIKNNCLEKPLHKKMEMYLIRVDGIEGQGAHKPCRSAKNGYSLNISLT